MAGDRGLASVPRGLGRELTQYLQSVDAVVRRLSGLVRGSDAARAVRASEAHTAFGGGSGAASPGLDMGAIATQVLRDGSVTERKIAESAVSASKIRENAVTSRAIAPGEVIENALREGCVSTGKLAAGAVTAGKLAARAVTADKLAAGAVDASALAKGCVTADKLADGVLPEGPELFTGEAQHGEVVLVPGTWDTTPVILITRFDAVVEEHEITDAEGVTRTERRCRAGACAPERVAGGEASATGAWSFEVMGDVTWVAVCK